MALRRGYPDDLAEGPHVAALGEYMAGMPMTEVAALHRTLREKHPGLPPVVMPLPQRGRVPDALSFTAANQAPLVAGQYAYVHLFNPAGSGVTLEVTRITAWGPTAGTTALALDDTAALLGGVDLGAGWLNRYLGSAVSMAHIEIGSQAAAFTRWLFRPAVTVQPQSFTGDPLLVIPEGRGIAVTIEPVAMAVWAEYEWNEVS